MRVTPEVKSIKVTDGDGGEQKSSSVFQEKRVTSQNWQTVMTKERSPVFFSGKKGVTPSVAAPGDTHPSDATSENSMIVSQCMF